MELELENNINTELISGLEEKQVDFLESSLGKVINGAVDLGLKAVLPDLVENQIIDVKNSILTNGFREGIQEAINAAIDTGKSAMGIVTGSFENISQIDLAVKKGGLLDSVSKLLDYAINFAGSKNMISNNIAKVLKSGKNGIVSTISNSIEESLSKEIKSVERIDKYCEKWNEAFESRDLDKMENALKNIKSNLEKVVPLENTINKARYIENLHSLIKNSGNFEITEEQMKLVQYFN